MNRFPPSEIRRRAERIRGGGLFSLEGTTLRYYVAFSGLLGNVSLAHLHGPAPAGANAPPLFDLLGTRGARAGVLSGESVLGAAAVTALEAGETYVNIHTSSFGGGEVRGQVR